MKIIKGENYFLVKTQDLQTEEERRYRFTTIDATLEFMNGKSTEDINGSSCWLGGHEYIYEVKEVTDYEVDYESDKNSIDEKDWYWSLKEVDK